MNIQLTDKKIQIFKSTLKLINENGFHGSPMSQIAKVADVAVGSIYHYFPSKDDLIIELYWYCKEIINTQVFRKEEDNLPYELKFRAIWKNLVDFYLREADIFGFMEQFYGSPFYSEIRTNILNQKSERNKIIHFLVIGIKEEKIKDFNIRILMSAYLGSAISLIRNCMYEKSRISKEDENKLVDLIWNGVKK